MSFKWNFIWTKEVKKYYEKHPEKNRFKQVLINIGLNPYQGPNIKRLTGELAGMYRYRFSNFRLIYQINESKKEVVLIYFGTRGDIY